MINSITVFTCMANSSLSVVHIEKILSICRPPWAVVITIPSIKAVTPSRTFVSVCRCGQDVTNAPIVIKMWVIYPPPYRANKLKQKPLCHSVLQLRLRENSEWAPQKRLPKTTRKTKTVYGTKGPTEPWQCTREENARFGQCGESVGGRRSGTLSLALGRSW